MTSDQFVFRNTKVQLNRKEKTGAFLSDALCLWIYLAGVFGWMIAAFHMTVIWPICVAGWMLVAAGIAFFLYSEKKIRYIGAGVWGLLLLGTAVLFHQSLRSGLNQMLNQIIDVIGKQFPYMWPFYDVSVNEVHVSVSVSLTIIWVSCIMGFLGAYMIKSENRLLIGMHILLVFGIQMAIGVSTAFIWNTFAVLSILALWMRSHGEKLPEGCQRLAFIGSLLSIEIGLCILWAMMQVIFPANTYKKNEAAEQWKEEIADEIEDRRYQGESKLLPEGDFLSLGSFSPSEKVVLKVTMTEPESYYLRGFTGSVYTGTGWEETDPAVRYQYRNLFYWLHEDGYYGQETLSHAAIALGDVGKEEINIITIENISGSSKYCYVPYELNSTYVENTLPYDRQKIGDENLTAEGWNGNRNYAYAALSNQITGYATFAEKLLNEKELSETAKKYQKMEAYYNEYVYKTYLDIPGNMRSQLSKIAGKVTMDEGNKHAEYAEAKQNILYLLNSQCVFQETLKENWDGADFVIDFLTRTKEGYSVHFASAAAMLFRYYGIPARYVEGYLITPQDVEYMTENESYMIDETHAHAWVEYYQDGVGWIPFEVTPSYLNVMPKAEEYQDISGSASSSGSKTSVEEEKPEEEEEEKKEMPDYLLILEYILVAGIAVFILGFLGLLIYVIILRQKSKKARRLFESDDRREAVRSIFTYTMNILAATGLPIRNISLYRYGSYLEKMYDEDVRKQYGEVVAILQEAIYSNHEVTEEQRKIVVDFKDCIWQRVYEDAGLIQKLQLKYIYFL